MRNQLALMVAPLAILVTAHTRANAHPYSASGLALAVGGDVCAPYQGMGYCFEAYEASPIAALLGSGPSVIVIQSTGGKYVQAFGKCSDCSGAWYMKGSAVVGRTYMGQIVEGWKCKGRYELGITFGNGHCHRIK